MGVLKLHHFIKETGEVHATLRFPPSLSTDNSQFANCARCTVLVDSMSIMLATQAYPAFMEQSAHNYPFIHPDADILGGEAIVLKEACRRVLVNMREHLRMNLVLVSDAQRFDFDPFVGVGTATGAAALNAAVVAYDARTSTLQGRVDRREEKERQMFRYANGEALSKQVSVAGRKATNTNSASMSAVSTGEPPKNFQAVLCAVIEEINAEAAKKGEDPTTFIRSYKLPYDMGEVDEAFAFIAQQFGAKFIVAGDSDITVIQSGIVTISIPFDLFVMDPNTFRDNVLSGGGGVLDVDSTSHEGLCRSLALEVTPNLAEKILSSSPSSLSTLFEDGDSLYHHFMTIPGDSLLLYVACALNGNDVTERVFFEFECELSRDNNKNTNNKNKKRGKKNGKENGNEGANNAGRGKVDTNDALFIAYKRFCELAVELDTTIPTNYTFESYPIVVMCKRLLALRRAAASSDSASATLRMIEAAQTLKTLLTTPMVCASTRQYIRSSLASRSPLGMDEMVKTFAPHLKNHRDDELRFCLKRALIDQRPVEVPMFVCGLPDPLLEANKFDCFKGSDCPKSLRETATAKRLALMNRVLVVLQRKSFGIDIQTEIAAWGEAMLKIESGLAMRNSKAAAAAKARQQPNNSDYSLLLPLPKTDNSHWYGILTKRTESQRLELFYGLFDPSFANAADVIDNKKNDSVLALLPPGTELCRLKPNILEAVLWMAHPIVFEDELKVMAALGVISLKSDEEKVAIINKLKLACGNANNNAATNGGSNTGGKKAASTASKKAIDYWKSRGVDASAHRDDGDHVIPAPRALMLAALYGHAFSNVTAVVNCLDLDLNEEIMYPASLGFSKSSDKSGLGVISHLKSSFSGSLVHYLYEKRLALESVECLEPILNSAICKNVLSNVLKSIASFKAVQEAEEQQQKAAAKKVEGGSEGSTEEDDEAADNDALASEAADTLSEGFGCRGPSSKLLLAGAADGGAAGGGNNGWIGMLHRDELADLLDEGDTEVIAGGIVVGGKGVEKSWKNADNNVVAFQAASMQKAQSKDPPLPIVEHMPKILRTVRKNNVVCIQGETGCGKSSMIPLEIYRDAVQRGEHVNILVTQPRRLAARALADRVSSLLGQQVGEVVGYRMGGGTEFHCDSKKTRIRFVTTGYLLESLIGNPSQWEDVTHFILDEVHERSLDADMLSLVLKVTLGERLGMSLEDLQDFDAACQDWDSAKAEEDEPPNRMTGVPLKPICEGSSSDDGDSDSNGEAPDWEHDAVVDSYGNVRDKRTGLITHASKSTAAVVLQSESAGKRVAKAKVVVMSATIQAKLFQTYFSPLMQERLLAPNVFVGAKRFPVKEYFLDEFISSFPDLPDRIRSSLSSYNGKSGNAKPPTLRGEATNAIVDVAMTSVRPGTAVLIFLPGLDEIEAVVEQLQNISDNTPSLVCKLRVFAVHSVVDVNEQNKSIGQPEDNECNIIVATNIAETSLTIPNLRIVIDVGMSKRMSHDAKRNIRMLTCGWCSKSAAKQRAGRTGRVGTGMVVRMYPKATFEEHMPDFDPSEFYPLEYSVLQVRHHLSHFGSIPEVMALLIEPPVPEEIEIAIDALCKIGALDEEEQVTNFGRVALRMPVELRMTKGLMAAASLGCAAEMVVAVAGMSMPKAMFARPIRPYFETETAFLTSVISVATTSSRFERIPHSDIHTFLSLFAFSQLPRNKQARLLNQLERQDIAFRSLTTFAKTCRNIANSLLGIGIPFHEEDEVFLKKIISFTGYKRGVVDDEDDEEDEGAGENVNDNDNDRWKKMKKTPLPPKKAAPESIFPWEFRAFTTPSHNALLQVALAVAADCGLSLASPGAKDAEAAAGGGGGGKKGKKGGKGGGGGDDPSAHFEPMESTYRNVLDAIGASRRSAVPALAKLPRATVDALSVPYLTQLIDIKPDGLVNASPAKLPYYFARTIVFKTPPRVVQLVSEEFERKASATMNADFNLRPTRPAKWTAENSKAVANFQASFTKIFSGLEATLTLNQTAQKAALSVGLRELGLVGSSAAAFSGEGEAAKITILKRNKPSASAAAVDVDGLTEMMAGLEVNEKKNGTNNNNSSSAAASAPAATLPKVARLQLMVLHPAIRGLLMNKVISRTRQILVPISPPTFTRKEGEAFELKDVLTFADAYKLRAHTDTRWDGQVKPDRWGMLCTPETLPIVPITVQEEYAKQNISVIETGAAKRYELAGVSFGMIALGTILALGASVVVGGTPLQQMLSRMSTRVVESHLLEHHHLNVYLTYVPQRHLNRVPVFISKIGDDINLQNLMNTTPTSSLTSSFGAPLHGLVSLLAMLILLHISKTTNKYQVEKQRLLSILHCLDSLSGSLPNKEGAGENPWLKNTTNANTNTSNKKYNNTKTSSSASSARANNNNNNAAAEQKEQQQQQGVAVVEAAEDDNNSFNEDELDQVTFSSKLRLSFDAFRFSDQSCCYLPNLEQFFETEMFVGEDGFHDVLPKTAANALEYIFTRVMGNICKFDTQNDDDDDDSDDDGNDNDDDEGPPMQQQQQKQQQQQRSSTSFAVGGAQQQQQQYSSSPPPPQQQCGSMNPRVNEALLDLTREDRAEFDRQLAAQRNQTEKQVSSPSQGVVYCEKKLAEVTKDLTRSQAKFFKLDQESANTVRAVGLDIKARKKLGMKRKKSKMEYLIDLARLQNFSEKRDRFMAEQQQQRQRRGGGGGSAAAANTNNAYNQHQQQQHDLPPSVQQKMRQQQQQYYNSNNSSTSNPNFVAINNNNGHSYSSSSSATGGGSLSVFVGINNNQSSTSSNYPPTASVSYFPYNGVSNQTASAYNANLLQFQQQQQLINAGGDGGRHYSSNNAMMGSNNNNTANFAQKQQHHYQQQHQQFAVELDDGNDAYYYDGDDFEDDEHDNCNVVGDKNASSSAAFIPSAAAFVALPGAGGKGGNNSAAAAAVPAANTTWGAPTSKKSMKSTKIAVVNTTTDSTHLATPPPTSGGSSSAKAAAATAATSNTTTTSAAKEKEKEGYVLTIKDENDARRLATRLRKDWGVPKYRHNATEADYTALIEKKLKKAEQNLKKQIAKASASAAATPPAPPTKQLLTKICRERAAQLHYEKLLAIMREGDPTEESNKNAVVSEKARLARSELISEAKVTAAMADMAKKNGVGIGGEDDEDAEDEDE